VNLEIPEAEYKARLEEVKNRPKPKEYHLGVTRCGDRELRDNGKDRGGDEVGRRGGSRYGMIEDERSGERELR
jgi:hypothetical protein